MTITERNALQRSWLEDVAPDKVFWCQDGRALKNLAELATALSTMSEDTFRHHANKEKNDFSNWVRDVVGDTTLARELKKVGTQGTAFRKADARLRYLNKGL